MEQWFSNKIVPVTHTITGICQTETTSFPISSVFQFSPCLITCHISGFPVKVYIWTAKRKSTWSNCSLVAAFLKASCS